MEEIKTTSPHNKKTNYYWIILIVVAIILFSTNPNESQFKDFLKEDFKAEEKSEGFQGQLIAGPTASLVGLTTVREEYYIFSTYEISVLGEKYSYIGILNHFSRIK